MPNLGSLWYTMGIKDLTDADLKKINAKFKDLGFDITLTPKILKNLTQAAVPKGVKIELDPTIKSEAIAKAVEGKVMRIAVTPLLTGFREAIAKATRENPPQTEVGVSEARLRTLIQNVLNKQGFMLNISTVNDNYSKVVQQKLNGTRYTVKIHADANEITRSVQASLMQVQSRYFGLKVSRDILYRSIDEALGQKRFNINIAVQQDQARKAVQDALLRAQVMGLEQTRAYNQLKTGELRAAQTELARLKTAHLEAASAAKAHATASVNLGGAMGSNIKIAGELGSAMASLYSVHAAKEFLSQVIEIGGELEHQKIAMDTIFGDKGKTNELFGQIKGLARQSPFGVMELTKSVKALSAYGVQYNEIYDTAKRLADISAATSVDINRLILAFGKTRSRGFLDGLEAKQFAYANIPIYEMVRRKLEELEGQAVTTAQVMERMKKREIGFDIVKDVLWDMTDPGGKFYDMQEALAGSVKTSWKLVRDNIELMFGEIAESAVGNTLKSTAEILQGLTREWRTVGTVVGTAAIGLGVYKVAQIGVNQVMQQGTAKTYEELMAAKQRDAQRLRSKSLLMELTATEKARLATVDQLTKKELRNAVANDTLTLSQVEQLYVTGKLNKAHILSLYHYGLIDKATAKAILSNNRFTISLKGLGMAMASVGNAAKAFLLNPWTIGIAAISAAMGLWQKYSEKIEETKENIKQLGETAREGSKNLSAEVERLNAQNPETMVSSEFLNSIEEMKNVLKDYDPTWMNTFKEAFSRDESGNIKSLAEQYDILKQAAIDTAEAYKYLNQIKDAAYDAQDETDGWLDDSMLENIKDFSDASRKYEKIVGKLVARSDLAEKAISFGVEASPAYALAAANKPLEEQIKLLIEYKDAWSAVFKGFNVRYSLLESWGIGRSEEQKFIADLMDLPSKIQDVNTAINSMQEDEGKFAEGLKSRLEGKWGDMEKWTEPMKKAVIKAVRDVYSKAEGVSKEEADRLANQTLSTVFKFKITTDFELDSQQLNDWQTELDNLTENQFTTIIRMAPDYLSALNEIQKATDEAQKQLDDAKLKMPIDIQFNGDFGMKPQDIPGWNVMSPSSQNAAMSMLGWLKQLAGASAGKITPTPQKPKGGTQKDEFAEAVKERINLLKKAKSEYESLAKLVGTEAASKELAESPIFAGLKANEFLSEQSIPKTLEDYEKALGELQMKLTAKGLKTKKHRELNVEIEQVKFDINKKKTEEALQLALDKVSKEAERQLADWNLFDKIRKATGNKQLAMNIAFGMGVSGETDYVTMVKNQFDEVAKAAKSTLTFDTATPDALTEAPDEVKKAWEKAYDLIQKYSDKEREDVANMVEQYRSTQEEIIALTAEAEEKKRKIRESKDLTPAEKEQITAKIDADLNYEVFRKSGEYLKFFNAILSMTGDEAEKVGQKIKEALDDKLKAGRISANDYCDEMEKIDKQLEKIRQKQKGFGGLGSFVKGGLQQMFNDRFEQAQSDYNAATQNFDTAKQQFDLFSKEGNEAGIQQAQSAMDAASAMKEGAASAMQGAQGAMSTVAMIDTIVHGINDTVQGIKGSFDLIADMAGSFGVDTSADTGWGAAGAFLDAFSEASQHATNAWDSLKSGNIGGVIQGVVGSVTSWFTTFNRWHDAKLQKQIERSQEAAQIMQNQYDILEKRMANFLGNAANMKVEGYSGEGGAYGKQRELMQGQLAELEKQRQAEMDKKKSDNSVVEDYNKQIEEMKISIRDFAIETANALYGIDLNGWAEQLGDSLVDAFAAGEDAAEAFDKTVGDILRDVTSKMISQDILAPMFGDLRNFLFGENGMSGAFGADFKLDASEMAAMKTYLDKIKDEGIPAAEELFNAINEATGGILNETDTAKSGLSAGIQGVTEDTASLLASYLNSIRADVSLQTHDYWTRLLNDSLPQISVIAQSQLDTQRQIAENTLRNAVAAEAIVKSNDDISRLLTRVTQGGAKFYVN